MDYGHGAEPADGRGGGPSDPNQAPARDGRGIIRGKRLRDRGGNRRATSAPRGRCPFPAKERKEYRIYLEELLIVPLAI